MQTRDPEISPTCRNASASAACSALTSCSGRCRSRPRAASWRCTGASAAASDAACGSAGSPPGLASVMRSLYTLTRVRPPQRAATSGVLYCSAHALGSAL